MEDNYNKGTSLEEEGNLSVQDIFSFLWRIKFWILLTVAIAMTFAYYYLKAQTRVYERTTWIMMNGKDEGLASQLSFLSGAGGSGSKLDDEVFILKSPSLMQKVVERLGLNTRYYHYVNPFTDKKTFDDYLTIKQEEFYGNCPYSMVLDMDPLYPKAMRPSSIRFEFKHVDDNFYDLELFTVNGAIKDFETERMAYGDTIVLSGFDLVLSLDYKHQMVAGDKYVATWTEPFAAARGFLGGMSVEVQGAKLNRTHIVLITYRDSSPARAADIINTLVDVSNQEARKYKTQASQEMIGFIDNRLNDIAEQLSEAEEGYKEYQASQALVNSNSQTNLTLNSDRRYKDNLTEVMLQLEVLRMVYDFMIKTPKGTYRVVPSYIVVSDAGLSNMISKYNDKVVARDRMVYNSSVNNPMVLTINTELNASKRGIELSLENLIRVYTLRQRELEKVLDKSRDQIAAIPEQQLQMQHLSRKVEVIEPLFVMLQKKKEEMQISMYGVEDTFRIVEVAFGDNAPVAPKGSMIYMVAFVLGFAFCPAVLLLRLFLRGKVETKVDVERAVDAPVLAVLPKVGEKENHLVTKTGRDRFSESYRMFRSNIQALEDARVLQVTSSVMGEGKSFVSSNIALSLAHVGKKVVLIGMDLRRPSLPKMFECEFNHKKSLVGYLIGKEKDINEIVVPSGVSHNLDIVFTGLIPPDPTVLLSSDMTRELIEEFKTRYDYVIIDSAPYFLVTDSSIINKYVDATIYVVRCDNTSLKSLKEVNTLIHRDINPIKRAHMVLNDFNFGAMKYRYGYGEGYGNDSILSYGYTYKYSYGYGKKEKSESEQELTED